LLFIFANELLLRVSAILIITCGSASLFTAPKPVRVIGQFSQPPRRAGDAPSDPSGP
jgi:hypothetical protein